MRVIVVGAGVSGVVTARVLHAAGFQVTVFEAAADLGGVWSASRAYPNIATQDDRSSYSFSDFPLPPDGAEHPSGVEVRAYLEAYAEAHDVSSLIHLETRVIRADLLEDGLGWRVQVEGPAGSAVFESDWLVAANGVFSAPLVPDWEGREAFEAAGGRILTPGSLGDGAVLDGRRLVLVGWGKTACDVAAAAVGRASSISMVARTITWKYPKRLGLRALTFRHLVLTRAGERLIGTPYRSVQGRVLLRRLPERIPRKVLGRLVARAIERSTGVHTLGLRPNLDISASTSLVTDGFFEAVAAGRIVVHREQVIRRLGAAGGAPQVTLQDGTVLAAEVVVAATGYAQTLEFIDPEVLRRVTDEHGGLLLHRRILAEDVPRLAFVGWAHSYRSPVTAELSAIWLAAYLLGEIPLHDPARRRTGATTFHLRSTGAPDARAAHLPGVSLRELDELLRDIRLPLSARACRAQMFAPMDPRAYSDVLPALLARARGASLEPAARRRARAVR